MKAFPGFVADLARALAAAALAGVLLVPAEAGAQSVEPAERPATADPAAAGRLPCTCRAAGVSYELAACTCLATPAGPRLACCGKVLNNTAWQFTDGPCPTARAPDARLPEWRTAAGGAQTAGTPPRKAATASH